MFFSDNRECKFQSLKFHDFCQHDQHCVKNKFVKNRVGGGGGGVKLNLDNVFKYTGGVLTAPPRDSFRICVKHTLDTITVWEKIVSFACHDDVDLFIFLFLI